MTIYTEICNNYQ